MVFDLLSRHRPQIEAALEYSGGTHTFDDVAAGVLTGRMQIWPTEASCIVTEIIAYPRRKVLNVFLGGGSLGEIMAMHPDVEAWARAQGCDALTMSGRRGWAKPLGAHGWRALHQVYEKGL